MTASTPQPEALIRLNKFVQATPQRVYDAWLDPERLTQWWMPGEKHCCSLAEIDARVGGRYRIVMGEGDEAPTASGEYLELEPGRKIVMTWAWAHAEGAAADTQITIELFETDNPYEEGTKGTEIVFTHERLGTAVERSEHISGWWNILRALGFHVRGVDPREALYGQPASRA